MNHYNPEAIPMLGHGVYGFREAAQLTGLRVRRVREWFRGDSSDGRKPVFQSDYPPVDGDYAVSFLDLVDVFVAGQLREYGVPLQTLRRVYSELEKSLRTPHPFGRRELLSDGKNVFTRGLDEKGREQITHVLTRQRVFPSIILPFLRRIDYADATNLAMRWHIDKMVVVDPEICFGKPVIEDVGIPTAVLAAAYHANGRNAELIADWYNVHADHVLAAARFEARFAA